MKKSLSVLLIYSFFLTLAVRGQEQANTTQKDAGDNKCATCHAALYEKKIKHPFSAGHACDDCHKSNGNEHPKANLAGFTMKEKMPDLCITCHAKVNTLATSSAVKHQAMSDKKYCLNCHTPHSSDEKGLLSEKKRDVCFSCHNQQVQSGTKMLANIEEQFKNGEVKHPPFKTCSSSCHNAHGSENYGLLSSPFPEGEYAPGNTESFKLCFECHDAELLEAATSTATGFRNGDKNLHFVHLNKEKGRKCTLCHSPHATKNLHLINEKVKFGNFEFKMNYVPNDNGGSCFPGCHSQKTYTQ